MTLEVNRPIDLLDDALLLLTPERECLADANALKPKVSVEDVFKCFSSPPRVRQSEEAEEVGLGLLELTFSLL